MEEDLKDDELMTLFKRLAAENVAMPEGRERQIHTIQSIVTFIMAAEDFGATLEDAGV